MWLCERRQAPPARRPPAQSPRPCRSLQAVFVSADSSHIARLHAHIRSRLKRVPQGELAGESARRRAPRQPLHATSLSNQEERGIGRRAPGRGRRLPCHTRRLPPPLAASDSLPPLAAFRAPHTGAAMAVKAPSAVWAWLFWLLLVCGWILMLGGLSALQNVSCKA